MASPSRFKYFDVPILFTTFKTWMRIRQFFYYRTYTYPKNIFATRLKYQAVSLQWQPFGTTDYFLICRYIPACYMAKKTECSSILLGPARETIWIIIDLLHDRGLPAPINSPLDYKQHKCCYSRAINLNELEIELFCCYFSSHKVITGHQWIVISTKHISRVSPFEPEKEQKARFISKFDMLSLNISAQ